MFLESVKGSCFDSQTTYTNRGHIAGFFAELNFLIPGNCLSILITGKSVAPRKKKENMKTKTRVFVLGCLLLITLSVAAATDKNCKKYKTLKIDFAVVYISTQFFTVQKGHQCFTHCSAEKNCVAVITTKMWKEDSDFCQILLYDKNLLLEQNFGTSNIGAHYGIWVNSAAQTTPQSAMNCVAPFTETTGGCFLVGLHKMSWDEAGQICKLYDAHLAELDTLEVCHSLVCFDFDKNALYAHKMRVQVVYSDHMTRH